MVSDWNNYFILTGTAGASLIGLMFVVVSLGADVRRPEAKRGINAFVTPTLTHFGGVLIQAMAMMVPWPSVVPLGIVLVLLGCGGVIYQLWTASLVRGVAFATRNLSTWLPYIWVPVLSNACVVAGAIGALIGARYWIFAVAASSALLLLAGVYRAWDLTLWVIRNRARGEV